MSFFFFKGVKNNKEKKTKKTKTFLNNENKFGAIKRTLLSENKI